MAAVMDMLRSPTSEELKPTDQESNKLARVNVPFEDKCAKFHLKSKKFTQQYSHIYNKRLLQLKESVTQSASKIFEGDYELAERVIDLKEGNKYYIVGTLYKSMKLKPSVLDQFKELAQTNTPVEVLDDYTDDEDTLILEDETGRVPLSALNSSLLPVRALSTGLVVAIAGVVDETGYLQVERWCPPGAAPYNSVTLTPPSAQATSGAKSNTAGVGGDSDSYVLLVSGLEVGGAHEGMPTSLLIDYVTGHIGSAEDVQRASQIARVIIAGNSRTPVPANLLAAQKLTKDTQALIHGPMKVLDDMLSVLACSVPVDLLPGDYDPSGHWLPQQPLPACVLPVSSNFNTLNRTTNPYEADVNGMNILGTSGQPINDLRRYAKHKLISQKVNESEGDENSDKMTNESGPPPTNTPEEEAEACLHWLSEMVAWRHMAPTAPDTLDTYPMLLSDPFVMETSPNIFFAGNQPAYAAKKVNHQGVDNEETLLISVPVFATTGTAVLVNLNTLECAPITFKGLC